MTEMIGRIFDRKYRIVRLLGEGGMGTVFEAEHTVIERKVAVKVMLPEFSSSDEVVSRFFREAKSASAIGHPNIVEIHDVGIEEGDGAVFIVMELLEGRSLKELIKAEGKLEPARATFIMLQVLSALTAAHEMGIIHRDMKPDNIFLSEDGDGALEVKLLDFGIAKVDGGGEEQGLTKTGTVLGTPHYMSPEQARGKEIDGRIDIWAVGVMLYEMLSGTLPYEGATYNEIIGEILLETPMPLNRLEPELPAGLIKTVDRAMAKDLEERYGRPQELMEALLPYAGSATELMSKSVAQALRSSLAPPPPDAGAPQGPPPGQEDIFEARLSHDEIDDLIEETAPPHENFEAPRKFERRSVAGVVVRIMLVLAVLGIAALFVTRGAGKIEFDPDKISEAANGFGEDVLGYWSEILSPMSIDQGKSQVDRSRLPQLDDLPDVTGADGGALSAGPDGGAEEDGGVASSGDEESTEPVRKAGTVGELEVAEEVMITVEGLPEGGELLLGGVRIKLPLILPQGTSEISFDVIAEGYEPGLILITPDREKTVQVYLEPLEARGKKVEKKTEKKKKKRRRSRRR